MGCQTSPLPVPQGHRAGKSGGGAGGGDRGGGERGGGGESVSAALRDPAIRSWLHQLTPRSAEPVKWEKRDTN